MNFSLSHIAMCSQAGARTGNEDRCATLLAPDGSAALLALADGMGGQACGEIASEIAIQTLVKAFEKYGFDEPDALLQQAIIGAHERIQREAAADKRKEGMGTTLVAAVLQEDRVLIGHVGDSRAFQFRDGCVRRLTEDHLYITEVLGLPESAAPDHPSGHVLAQALGSQGAVRPTINQFDVRPGDRILLCSDGVHGVLSEPELLEILKRPELGDSVGLIVKTAIAAGSKDNCTAVTGAMPA